MNILVYTTSSDKWYKDKAKLVEKAYAPYYPLTFTFLTIESPTDPVFRVDKDGDKCFDWNWFNATFPKTNGGVAFHFNKKFAKKWGIKLGGQRDSNHKDVPYFWLTADKEKAKGYDISNFERLLFHEPAHYWEDLDNNYGNKLVQDSVHHADYDLKDIHNYHKNVNFSLLLEAKKTFLQSQIDKLKALLSQQPAPFLKDIHVTQEFGVYNPIYIQTKHHIGLDLRASIGTQVFLPLDGTLTSTTGKETGLIATFETKQGTYQFLHLSACYADGFYKKGTSFALTGNSGTKTTGAHLCVRLWKGKPNVAILTKDNFKNYLTRPI